MSACPGIIINSKILIICNDNSVIVLLKLNLEAYGFYVDTTMSGKEGLNRVFSELPDTVILEVHMPDLNGWELYESLRKDSRTEATSVIFFTADPQKADFEKSKKLGTDLLLIKPIDPEELVWKIWGILDKNIRTIQGIKL